MKHSAQKLWLHVLLIAFCTLVSVAGHGKSAMDASASDGVDGMAATVPPRGAMTNWSSGKCAPFKQNLLPADWYPTEGMSGAALPDMTSAAHR
tara:strand:- start:130 stop:408 length:279 start_codon:yes stop_codon:yes gene_type:complete